MSIPRDLSLRTTAEGIRLFQSPTSVIRDSLSSNSQGAPLVKTNSRLKGAMSLSDQGHFDKNAYWIEAEIALEKAVRTGFRIAAGQDGSAGIDVGYDAEKQQVYVDCSQLERDNKDSHNLVLTAPALLKNGAIRLYILMDKSSLEVFTQDGEHVISTMIYPGKDANRLSIYSSGEALIKTLKVWNFD
jgi:levanase/fructan beta-fructosidase